MPNSQSSASRPCVSRTPATSEADRQSSSPGTPSSAAPIRARTATRVGADVGSVAWITIAPVKALALVHLDEVELEPFGVRENRRFYLVDEKGQTMNGKTIGELVRIVSEYDDAAGRLALRFPDGSVVDGTVETGGLEELKIYRRPVAARTVQGPWSEALSTAAGRALRLVLTEQPGDGSDR